MTNSPLKAAGLYPAGEYIDDVEEYAFRVHVENLGNDNRDTPGWSFDLRRASILQVVNLGEDYRGAAARIALERCAVRHGATAESARVQVSTIRGMGRFGQSPADMRRRHAAPCW